MIEQEFRRPLLFPLSAALVLAFLGAACGGSVSSHDGVGAASNGGASGSSPDAESPADVADAAGGSSAGVSDAGVSGPNGGTGPSSLPPHWELCLVGGTCTQGTISGVYGVNCLPFSVRCEFGCSEHPRPIQTAGEANIWDVALAAKYASAALCNASAAGDGGSGGDDSGDSGVSFAGTGGA